MNMNRLPYEPTQRIDRHRKIEFTYRNREMVGLAGDTLAAALYANGVRIFSRSLKYHRPRGLYSLDGESANCLMTADGIPNVQAEVTPLADGMAAAPQNVIGSPESDLLGLLDKFDRFMPAGFYYHWFHKPYTLWPLFQKLIRRAAGTGVVDKTKEYDTGRYEDLFLNADVCILGGGPAGMSAAGAAAQKGLRVVLVEARPWLGGFYDWRTREAESGQALYQRGRQMAEDIEQQSGIRIFCQAFVNNLSGDNLVTGFQVGGPDDGFDQRYFEVRAQSVVVATGCIERPLLFENNERPGVMQVACALRLARTYGIVPGREAVFSVGDDLGLEAAVDLSDLSDISDLSDLADPSNLAGPGLNVVCVADARPEGHDPSLTRALAEKNIAFLPGWAASCAEGKKTVSGVVLGDVSGNRRKRFDCDLIVASAGLSPATGPLSTAQAKLSFDGHTGFSLPAQLPRRVHAAGRLLGYTDPRSIETSGRAAGLAAALDAGSEVGGAFRQAKEMLDQLPGPAKGCPVVIGPDVDSGRKCFICFDEDATLKTARESCKQGFDVPELAKRFGGFGLGPGQGGIPGHNLPRVMAGLRGESQGDLHPTTVRSPLVPTLMVTYAGSKHDIFKQTPLNRQQETLDGVFRRVGVWKRARYFSRDFTSRVEIDHVRTRAGLIDVSTLGKFRLFGPDALRALQRVYISDMSRVVRGKLKYSAMLNDDGCLMDDGVVTRTGENDYYLTSSTSRAGETIEWFRYHTRYEGWDFNMVNLTDALGAINLAGPKAREILSRITGADVTNEALPYMGYREISLDGQVSCKVLRLGFVGELSYELHVPASQAPSVWQRLMEAGEEFGIKPFGLEAQSMLRLEKGHVIIGQESEQRVNLLDLGMGFLWDRKDMVSKKIGAPALKFTENQPDRFKLVGFRMDDSSRRPADGSIVYQGDDIKGFVCTCRFSTSLDASIGLALVRSHLAEEGGSLKIYQNEGRGRKLFRATVVSTPFYDPQGIRLKM